jgi:iron-sulfur cluster assembly protein
MSSCKKVRSGSVHPGGLHVMYSRVVCVPARTERRKKRRRRLFPMNKGRRGMAILLTESAADRVRSHLEKRGAGIGLRVGIKKTGCSGFAYVVNYADEIRPEDSVFEARGVKVVVDRTSLPLIDGTLVDFVKQGLNEAFKFQNPKAKGECGCGESFNV